MNLYFILGSLVWGIIIYILFQIRPNSRLHHINVDLSVKKNKIIVFTVLLVTILLCILPMGISPEYNEEAPYFRKQYENITESFLKGQLHFDVEIDPVLAAMENPYDETARKAVGAKYNWDHAYYDGHYYMYFGVVPVFLLFLPFRIITGTSLASYHATQIFVAFIICGIFAMFHMMAKKYFKQISLCTYLMLSSAFSIMTVWYSVDAPAMYCTAITAALCVEVWSLYFFMKAVWIEEEQKKTIMYAFFGSLLGALSFGCRPTIALANLLVIPLLVEYLRKRKIDFTLIKQLVVAASPYLVVAILLMAYNYARFDSPFEFGQAYQLTVADQSNYGSFFERFTWNGALNGLLESFMVANAFTDTFPYITFNGILINYPIIFFAFIGLGPESVRKSLKEKKLMFFLAMLFIVPVIITIMDTVWSPYLIPRYRMDTYWLMGILCFFVIGFYYMHMSKEAQMKFSSVVSMLGFVTIISSILLFFIPNDGNVFEKNPALLEEIHLVLRLGIGAQ